MLSTRTQAALKKVRQTDGRVRHLVDDPYYEGPPPIPQIPRSKAMRKLAAAGVSITTIAEFYEVRYQTAYAAVRLVGTASSASGSSAQLEEAEESIEEQIASLEKKSKKQLLRIVASRVKEGEPRFALVAAAADELDRRFPGWV